MRLTLLKELYIRRESPAIVAYLNLGVIIRASKSHLS